MTKHALKLLAICFAAQVSAQPLQQDRDKPSSASIFERGWTTLRTFDCARCHGADYDGLAAPSLVAYVRVASRESFDRVVLEGVIPRGMPGYASYPAMVENLDAVYRYLKARADGVLPPGRPPSRHGPAEPTHR
jgi:hypothetical protein